jgi:enoyl-CoA hydratase/carnithine racemase
MRGSFWREKWEFRLTAIDLRDAMAYETLEIRQDGAVAWLILNRPHVLNALSYQLVKGLHRYFDSLRADKLTRVVL